MGIFRQFPYSNFHDMNMDEILKIVKTMYEEWQDTKEEWASYKDFIDNYFATLDVSEEVLAALRVFAADGTLNRIMDPVIAEQTGAWLARNISNPSNPPLDISLSVPNTAAPANVVGTRCSVYRWGIASAYGQNADLNDVKQNGIWYGADGNQFSNVPSFIRFEFLLEVWKQSDNIYFQRITGIESGSSATRICINGTWSKWSGGLNVFPVSQSYATNTLGGLLKNLPSNTVSYVNTSWFSDIPNGFTNKNVYVITLGRYTGDNSGSYGAQIMIQPASSAIYSRLRNATTDEYDSWETNYDYYQMVDKGSLTANYSDTVDVDNVTDIGIYFVKSPNTIINLPSNNMGELMVNRGTTGVTMQKFTDYRTGRVYVRWYFSEWSEWTSDTPHTSSGGKYYAYGDSIVQGQIAVSGNTSQNSYPLAVGKLTGITVINKAVRGQGLIKDNAAILDDINNTDLSDAGLITVGWAYNDAAYYSGVNFGSAGSTDDQSFIGHYYTVMKKLQEKAPNAVVILVTGYGNPAAVNNRATLSDQFTHSFTFADGSHTVKQMYDTLEEMCHANGWCCVNQTKGSPFNKFNAAAVIGDQIHPTANGYITYSNNIAARIAALYGNI